MVLKWAEEFKKIHPRVEVTHIRKKMGLLSQKPQVLPMSVFDNIAYGPKIHGLRDRKKLRVLVEHGPAAEFFANPRDPRTRAYLTGEIS